MKATAVTHYAEWVCQTEALGLNLSLDGLTTMKHILCVIAAFGLKQPRMSGTLFYIQLAYQNQMEHHLKLILAMFTDGNNLARIQ